VNNARLSAGAQALSLSANDVGALIGLRNDPHTPRERRASVWRLPGRAEVGSKSPTTPTTRPGPER